MARAAKICPHCPNLQPCPDHPKVAWAGSHRRRQLPRGWSHRIVPRILRRDPICTVCRAALSTEVHHTGDPHDHSDENLAGVCTNCHRAETLAQARTARTRRN